MGDSLSYLDNLLAVFIVFYAVIFSLHEVLISFYIQLNPLYAVLSSCKAIFFFFSLLFLLSAVANSLYEVLSARNIHGASLSLDFKRDPRPLFEPRPNRHFDRAQYKFRLSTASERFSPKHGSCVEIVRCTI